MYDIRAVFYLAILPIATVLCSALVIFYTGPLIFSRAKDICKMPHFDSSHPILGAYAVKGLAWGDYNSDGWDDLFIAAAGEGRESVSRLLQNVNGTLIDVTEQAGLPPALKTSSGIFSDYDNDGFLDLFVVDADSEETGISLRAFRNRNGVFKEVTDTIIPPGVKGEGRFSALALGDIDSDGKLEIAVSFFGWLQYNPPAEIKSSELLPGKSHGFWTSRYVCEPETIKRILDREPQLLKTVTKKEFFLKGGCLYVAPSEAAPGDQRFTTSYRGKYTIWTIVPGKFFLLRNTKNGFTVVDGIVSPAYERIVDNRETSPASPWEFISHKYHQPLIFDFTGDGRNDIFIAVDGGRNILLENTGNFTFHDISGKNGLEIFGTGMGVAVGDLYRHGVIDDLLVTNVGKSFLFQKKNGNFWLDYNVSLNRNGFGWGVAFLDYDNDGWDDIMTTNGTYAISRESDIFTSVYYGDSYKRDLLYQNSNGFFVDVTGVDICPDSSNTRPLAVGDVNNDGYEDFAIGTTNKEEGNGFTLFTNKGGENHYIRVKLYGTRSNRAGVGAVITVTLTDGSSQAKAVLAGESYNSQNSLMKTFGLGKNTKKVKVHVLWPSGVSQNVGDVTPDQILEVEEPKG